MGSRRPPAVGPCALSANLSCNMTSDEPSRVWIERATQGDVVAVDALLGLHLPELQEYVRRRMGDVLDQESSSDLVQSTCREVLQHLDRFQFDGEEGFRRWLWATALRKIKAPEHFAFEEAGGYLSDALAIAPRLSKRAAVLRRDHREFTART